jgi:hypothetical protein
LALNEIDKIRFTIIRIAIIAVGTLSLLCVASLCLTLFYKNYADPVVLTAIITITGTLTGSLTTIMVLPRPKDQPQQDITVSSPPQTVEVKNPEPEVTT